MAHYKVFGSAVEYLRTDHEHLTRLAQRCFTAVRNRHFAQTAALTQQLCRMLTLHSLITEEILYPEARKHDDALVADLLIGQQEILQAASRLRRHAACETEYEVTLGDLIDRVERYIATSELALFPLLERQIPAELLCRLALELGQRRRLLHARSGRDKSEPRGRPATRASRSIELRARAA